MTKYRKHSERNKNKNELNRREFIKEACFLAAGSIGGISLIAQGSQPLVAGQSIPGKMIYRSLGRTGLNISVVVAGEMDYLPMHERAYELGVNYWHKVGNFEHPGPEFFKNKDRDSFYCDMVIDALDKEGAIAQFEWGLKQSGLEYIDFFKLHSPYRDPKDITKFSGILQAFDYLKKQKKTRYLALAQHYKTAEICVAAIESGLFDQIQPNFSVFSGPKMHDMIALAKKHEVGVICKKVLAGGDRFWQRRPERKIEIEKRLGQSKDTLGQAMLKWALNVPGVTAVVPLITNFKHLEEDIAVGFEESKLPVSESMANNKTINKLAEGLSSEYCRSCGMCTSVCPERIAIADIFRFDLYSSAYGRDLRAKKLYRKLSTDQTADKCDSCGACENACPHRLPIIEKLRAAHALLA